MVTATVAATVAVTMVTATVAATVAVTMVTATVAMTPSVYPKYSCKRISEVRQEASTSTQRPNILQ